MRKGHRCLYTICNYFAPEWFSKHCIALEKHIPSLKKMDLLEDVDESQYQKYTHPRFYRHSYCNPTQSDISF